MRRLFIDLLPPILRMERPNKYEREYKNERKELKLVNSIRASRVISLKSPTTNSQPSLTTEHHIEHQLDSLLAKEIYEAAEDISFIANKMRSASEYEEVVLNRKISRYPSHRFLLFLAF